MSNKQEKLVDVFNELLDHLDAHVASMIAEVIEIQGDVDELRKLKKRLDQYLSLDD